MSAASIQSVRPTRRIGAWTLQAILAAAFLAAGLAKLAGVPFMVELFEQIGLGQWFRVVTGVVEVTGAVALLVPGLASIGALGSVSPWLVRWRPMCSSCTPVRSRRSSSESSTRWLSTCGVTNSLPCFTGSRAEL
jgi:UPF0716 family protein affecting phage T7 exclusion